MGKQVAPNYRGKGVSKTKFKKDGTPKHAGNFSAMTIKCAGVRSKDYKVKMIDGVLIVGVHTPLLALLPAAVVEMAMSNGYFYEYQEKGVHTHNGIKYDAYRSLIKHERRYSLDYLNYEFVYREIIYTNCDEDVYQFPEY